MSKNELPRINTAPARSSHTPVVTPPPAGVATEFDDDARGFAQQGPQLITGLRVYDGAVQWELPRNIKRFLGGASRPPHAQPYDISLPDSGLSATHFMLERRDGAMRLYDQHSKHGTWVMDSPVTTADLRPGWKFTAKPVTFVAMNDAMRLRRPTLVDILGEDWIHTPDSLLVLAAGAGHILITGEDGCGHKELAHAIHAMSPREAREPVELDGAPDQRAAQMQAIKRASKQSTRIGTTVVLKLAANPDAMDETFVDLLFSSAYGLRVIILAPAVKHATSVLGGERVSLCQQVLLRPLNLRVENIPQLLDRMLASLAEPGATSLRALDLLPENVDALKQHKWPGNLDELRYVARVIVAHAKTGGWRGTAELIGEPHNRVHEKMSAIGLRAVGKPRASLFQRRDPAAAGDVAGHPH